MSQDNFIKNIAFNPAFVFVSQKLGNNCAVLLGRMWRYSQMGKGICEASIETLSFECGMGINTTKRCLKKLEKHYFIVDMTPNLRYTPHQYRVKENYIFKYWQEYQLFIQEKSSEGVALTFEILQKFHDSQTSKMDNLIKISSKLQDR